MAGGNKKGDQNGKQKAEEKKQMCPPGYQWNGPVVMNRKTAPQGKSGAKGQTKGQVKDLMMQPGKKLKRV